MYAHIKTTLLFTSSKIVKLHMFHKTKQINIFCNPFGFLLNFQQYCIVTEINSGTHEIFKSNIQETTYAHKPRDLVHK